MVNTVVFDAVVLGFVALAAILGAWKGFTWQLGAVLAPVAGLTVGWPLSAGLAPHLSLRAPFDRWVAFGLLYVLLTLVLYLAALWARRSLERAELGAWDRHLGFLLGAAKGCALALVFTAAALAFSKDLRVRFPDSHASGLMSKAVRTVRPVLPPAASELLSPWFELLEPAQREKA